MTYALLLNDMRSPNIENLVTVATAETREELVAFHNGELAEEGWMDGKWGKAFKPGSPLEWCNPSSDLDSDDAYFGGIYPVPEGVTGVTLSKW